MVEQTIRLEPNHRRLRVVVDGVIIADTIHSIYLFETGHLPVYYFPKDDIRFDLLESTDRVTHCPLKGDAEYWSIVVGDRRIEDAVWSYPSPIGGAPDLSAHVAFYWNKVDNWFEEDEEVFVHARDPYKRVDALRRLAVSKFVSMAKPLPIPPGRCCCSRRACPLANTSRSSTFVSTCCARRNARRPARTRAEPTTSPAVVPGTEIVEDITWVYRTPIPQVPTIENHLCFFNERVDILVDGLLEVRPTTAWS